MDPKDTESTIIFYKWVLGALSGAGVILTTTIGFLFSAYRAEVEKRQRVESDWRKSIQDSMSDQTAKALEDATRKNGLLDQQNVKLVADRIQELTHNKDEVAQIAKNSTDALNNVAAGMNGMLAVIRREEG